jgi:uncharacterized protein
MRAVLCGTVGAALLFASALHAQGKETNQPQADSTKVALIHELLATTHAVDLAIATIESSIPAQRTANPQIPAEFWDRFLKEVRNRRGELEDMVGLVYAHHFSSAELRDLISFYKSPIGQKMVSEMPAVMQESMQAGRQWGGRLGASVATQLKSEGVQFGP